MEQQANRLDLSSIINAIKFKNADKETKLLNKNLASLSKTILAMAKVSVPQLGQGSAVADIAKNRNTYNTVAENLRAKMVGRGESSIKAKYGSVRGVLNTFGVIEKGSGGVIDQMLERREAKKQFIADQLKVNPQMKNTKENRETFGKKFETQQRIQKDLNKTSAEIKRLEEAGFTEKQIARSGLYKARDEQSAKLIASDNRLYDMAKSPLGKKPAEDSGVSEELKNETAREDKAKSRVQEAMASDVSEIRKIMEEKDKPKLEVASEEKSGWFKGLLAGLGTMLATKFTSLVSMLSSSFSAVMKPIMAFLGAGATKAVDAGKALISKGAEVVKSGARTVLEKGKGIIRAVGPKVAQYGRAAGTLATRAALPLAAVTTAGYAGYKLGEKVINPAIDAAVSMATGEEGQTLGGWVYDKLHPMEKTNNETKLTNELSTKRESNEKIKKESDKKTDVNSTVISAPTTVNHNSKSNNIMKLGPRNQESSFNKYLPHRYAR